LLLALSATGCSDATVRKINGTGSTLVAPMMTRWAQEYEQARGTQVGYEPVGSSIGVQRLHAGILDFACTDAPLTDKQLEALRRGGGEIVRVPLVISAVVPAYNLPEITSPLVLNGPVLADIYLGSLKKWNDKPIKDLNPGAELPAREIAVMHRAEGSGTTFIWTDYLAKVSPAWKSQVGVGATVPWPTGTGQSDNRGVAAAVKATPGSIGYLPLSYAVEFQLPFALVKNQEGIAVKAGPGSATAAADALLSGAADDLPVALTNAPAKEAYPVCGMVWAVFYRDQAPSRRAAVIEFLRWATHDGQAYTEELHYARLPTALVERVDRKLAEIK
jgi:phosphate transport system substrate-binding protein